MKKLPFLIFISVLIISFFAVLVLSPSEKAYKAQFSSDNYEKILEIPITYSDIDQASDRALTIVHNFVFRTAIMNGKTENIEILISKTINEKKREYIRNNLSYELFKNADIFKALDLRINKGFSINRGVNWLITFGEGGEITSPDTEPFIKIIVPENIIIEEPSKR